MKTALLFACSIAAAVVITFLVTNSFDESEGLTSEGITPEALTLPDGQLYWPRGVAYNTTSNTIWVMDTQNSRGQIFDSDSEFQSSFGFPGNSKTDGSLNLPFGIFINDTSGDAFVSDTNRNVIKIYDKTGAFVDTIGSPGTGSEDLQFYRPSGMAGNSTHIFVADAFNNRIVIIDTEGGVFVQAGTIPITP